MAKHSKTDRLVDIVVFCGLVFGICHFMGWV